MIGYKKVTGEFSLKDKTAIVVGGAGGIGEATARMYAGKGAKVAIVDCKDTCPEVAESIKKDFGVETIGVKCDVTSQESVDSMISVPRVPRLQLWPASCDHSLHFMTASPSEEKNPAARSEKESQSFRADGQSLRNHLLFVLPVTKQAQRSSASCPR